MADDTGLAPKVACPYCGVDYFIPPDIKKLLSTPYLVRQFVARVLECKEGSQLSRKEGAQLSISKDDEDGTKSE